jgi:hypothetical protein
LDHPKCIVCVVAGWRSVIAEEVVSGGSCLRLSAEHVIGIGIGVGSGIGIDISICVSYVVAGVTESVNVIRIIVKTHGHTISIGAGIDGCSGTIRVHIVADATAVYCVATGRLVYVVYAEGLLRRCCFELIVVELFAGGLLKGTPMSFRRQCISF